MTLKEILNTAETPKARDRILSNIWKNFATTQSYEALLLILHELLSEANTRLLGPTSSNIERTHAAGQAFVVQRLLATMQAAVSFDPEKADYSEPDFGDENSTPAPPDPFTTI